MVQEKKLFNRNVLVLNKSWLPVHVTTLKEAIGLIFVGAAEVIVTEKELVSRSGHKIAFMYEKLNYQNWADISDQLDEKNISMVRSCTKRHFVPSVVCLTRWNGIPKYEVRFSRNTLYQRDKGKCQYCNKHLNKIDSTIDHVIPKSRGGKNIWENTVLSCKTCNEKKNDKTPEEAKMPLLHEPKKPAWISNKLGKANGLYEQNAWKLFSNHVF